ncbi:di-trans,poly-cis-decaprenylcistransferase [candidate division WWE3 bacterium RIFOXYD1_FULL_39_9]|uniref:Isoprenyl transferase n=1 Tax=candidate division WWE3 bacterium RIFOXYD1_FULL_39_9 TaxID=1802649 RepID=A0A1F4X936_UNCKA|nr:MAG: di-trans,poly-cis-decaprenylcistransferase [candidate division WWE3 bacterium RIFOXYD1_FULL_39_9]
MPAETTNIPNMITHVAIIPDGNRRWAKEKGLPTLEGHRRGAENFERLLNASRDMGIKYFTSWAFSTENWKRTEEENAYLFNLAREFTKKYKQKFISEKVRFVHLGRKDRIPADIVQILNEMEEETKHFTGFTAAIGMDYGGHDELLRTIKRLNELGLEVTEENIEKNLDTKGIPAPDLIIRTSGEKRLSGFMSWQSAYSEFYFPNEYFPDFGPAELKKAVDDFMSRDRRFGGDTPQK